MATRFCGYCGQPIPEGTDFCSECGHPLEPPQPQPFPNQPASFSNQPIPQNTNSIRLWLIGLIGLLVGLLFAIVLVFILKGNRQETAPAQTVIQRDTIKVETPAATAQQSEPQPVAAPKPAVPHFDGSYSISGDIRGEYFFGMYLSISGTHVSGSYRVYNGDNIDVSLSGSIDANGKMVIYEYYPDGTRTGYYFTGTFSGGRYRGKYLSTQRRINMKFHAE